MDTTTKQKLIKELFKKKRLPTTEEVFEFYTENIMRNEITCKYNPYKSANRKVPVYSDYLLWELEAKARNWFTFTVGSLVKQGILNIDYSQTPP